MMGLLDQKLSETDIFFFMILVVLLKPWNLSSGMVAVLFFLRMIFWEKEVLSSQNEEN